MTLVDLTDARCRALLVCRGCVHPPHLGLCTKRSGGTAYACACSAQTPRTEEDAALLTEAQRIADDIPADLAGALTDPDHHAWLDDPLHALANKHGFLYFSSALAALVLSLRERSR